VLSAFPLFGPLRHREAHCRLAVSVGPANIDMETPGARHKDKLFTRRGLNGRDFGRPAIHNPFVLNATEEHCASIRSCPVESHPILRLRSKRL
jgi:hypothetical protein